MMRYITTALVMMSNGVNNTNIPFINAISDSLSSTLLENAFLQNASEFVKFSLSTMFGVSFMAFSAVKNGMKTVLKLLEISVALVQIPICNALLYILVSIAAISY